VELSLTESNKHLLWYAVQDKEGKWLYPFARHERWMHWVQNTAERHQINGQEDVYLQKEPSDSSMSVEDLKKILEAGGDELKALLG